MKKIGNLILIACIILFTACTNEEITPDAEINVTNTVAKTTTCDIQGSTSAAPGTTGTYTYTSDFTPGTITWSVNSGNISIVSGQGTNTVTLSFGSNFGGGSVVANGVNGVINCSDLFTINCNGTAPTYVEFSQVLGECPGDIFEFIADPNGSTDSGNYQWTVFQGATILSGQGTNTIRVASPSSGGFLYRVTFTDNCTNTSVTAANLAEFDGSCGGGLGGF